MSTKSITMRPFLLGAVLALCIGQSAQSAAVLTTYQNQQAFVDMRFGMFVHFNLGTFTDQEWATPNQNPLLFAPTAVNCAQWAAAAKSAGMTFAVLTTKHHDGFCLWPTQHQKKNTFGTYQNVMYSGFKQDVVKLYVDAFRAAGVTPCLYFSIWDRTEGIDSGSLDSGSITPAQMATITGQLTELLTSYGDIPFLMFDGWTWMTGRQQVAYQTIRDTVKALQPNCLIADHNGLTQPYEEDILNFEHFDVPSKNTFASTQGNKIYGSGWFWHTASFKSGAGNGGVKSASSIGSVLKNTTEPVWCNYLLDCPPDTNGVIESDITDVLKQVPNYWTPNLKRAVLPDPGVLLEYPVTPVAVTATSSAAGCRPYWAIDGHADWVSGAAVQKLWQSAAAPSAAAPQSVTLDLGSVYPNISLLEYMPSQARTTGNDITTVTGKAGFITTYTIYVSVDNKTFTKVASGTFAVDGSIKKVPFTPAAARYVKLEATGTSGGGPAVVDEIDVGRSNRGTTAVADMAGKSAVRAFCRVLASGKLLIESPGSFKYRLLSAAGRELFQGAGMNSAIALKNPNAGIYFIEVHGRDGIRTMKIFRN